MARQKRHGPEESVSTLRQVDAVTSQAKANRAGIAGGSKA